MWLRGAAPGTPRYKSFSGKHKTSVAIVGGGITGALVARAFASAGVATTLLEAGLAGRGSTAASSAMLLKEPDLELTDLAERYGAAAGRRIWEMSADSVGGLVRLLTRLGVSCDLKQCDAIYYAVEAEAAKCLRAEFEQRRKFGFAVEWLGPGALRRATAISGLGAIRTSGNAQFDPYRACLGVLHSAAAAGAKIFERSRVSRITNHGDRVRLFTGDGALECDRVVIATGYATPYFRPLAGRFRMFRTYVLETESVSDAQRRELGLSDVMVWDTERPYHYARWSGRRLLLGGSDRLLRSGPRRKQFLSASDELRAYFEARLPALSEIKTKSAWEGLFAMTPDTLPYIGPHRRYPGHWFVLGYGGNGMTFGFMAAKLLLERWEGRVSSDHALFEFSRKNKKRKRKR